MVKKISAKQKKAREKFKKVSRQCSKKFKPGTKDFGGCMREKTQKKFTKKQIEEKSKVRRKRLARIRNRRT